MAPTHTELARAMGLPNASAVSGYIAALARKGWIEVLPSVDRGIRLLREGAPIDIVLLPPRVSKVIARRLESMLLHEAPDPNRSRQLLIERVECGAAWA